MRLVNRLFLNVFFTLIAMILLFVTDTSAQIKGSLRVNAPTFPDVPTATVATNILQTSFSANWNVTARATGYKLDVATDVGFTNFVAGFNNQDVANVTTYSITGLNANTAYFYRVRAYNINGTSISSNVVTTTTLPPLPPPNQPPVANAGSNQTVNVGTQVTLDGSASSDADGDALTYTWTEGTTALGTGVNLVVTLPIGVHTITLTVDDSKGGTNSATVVITVVSVAPTITVDDKPIILWPPNHHYETVKASQIVESVVDGNGKKLSIQNVRIYSVSSDESDDTPCNGNKHFNKNDDRRAFNFINRNFKNHGDSDDDDECDDRGDRRTKNDIIISDNAKNVKLRAEREGGGNGRVYTITLMVKDASGNAGYASYEVWVPQHKKDVAINDGPAYTVVSNSSLGKKSLGLSALDFDQPSEFKLYNNFPNPFNPSTEIQFAIMEDDFVSLKVYDLLGHEIATLVNNQLTLGTYSIHFDASRLSSGTYIYRLVTSTATVTKKMLLMK
jgi:hypothetical protein